MRARVFRRGNEAGARQALDGFLGKPAQLLYVLQFTATATGRRLVRIFDFAAGETHENFFSLFFPKK